jgi:hypothetical protein
MPYLGETHVGDRARREAAQTSFGPGFSQEVVNAMETLEVWYSSFNDPAPDYTEWKAIDSGGFVIASKRVGGY